MYRFTVAFVQYSIHHYDRSSCHWVQRFSVGMTIWIPLITMVQRQYSLVSGNDWHNLETKTKCMSHIHKLLWCILQRQSQIPRQKFGQGRRLQKNQDQINVPVDLFNGRRHSVNPRSERQNNIQWKFWGIQRRQSRIHYISYLFHPIDGTDISPEWQRWWWHNIYIGVLGYSDDVRRVFDINGNWKPTKCPR